MLSLQERDYKLQYPENQHFLGMPVIKQHFDDVITNSSYVYLDGHKPIVYLNLEDKYFDDLLSELNSLSFAKSTRKTLGDQNKSILFGAVSKKSNHDKFCNVGVTVCQSPQLNQMLKLQYSTVCDELMKLYLPQYQKLGKSILKHSGIHQDWHMGSTFWTSGIINKNSPHNFHVDGANASSAYSAMITMKRNMSGGYLVIPQYRLAFQVSNRSVIFFCGKEIMHGVSPMTIHKGGFRYSIVYYTTADLKFCGSYNEEVGKSSDQK